MSDGRKLFDMLKELGEGLHKCRSKRWYLNWLPFGWIEVTERGENYDAMWCSGKGTHFAGGAPAFSVEVDEMDNLVWVFKSAISMWPVRSEGEQKWYYRMMREKVSIILDHKAQTNP